MPCLFVLGFQQQIKTQTLGCLKATYFPNSSLSGLPTASRAETVIDFRTFAESSVRWEGTVIPPVSGAYTFTVTVDDGARLWVNNQLIIDKWLDVSSATTYIASLNLTQGQEIPIKLENYHHVSTGGITQLFWTIPNQTSALIPFKDCPVTTPPIDSTKCFRIVNKVSNKSLEVKDASTAEGATIFQWATVEGKANQLWQLTQLTDGTYTFKSKSSGKLIDAPDCTEGGIIKQFAADGTNSQRWALELQADVSYKLLNVSCNKYLRLESGSSADGASVGIKNDFGTDAFKWLIQEAACPVVDCNILPFPTYSAVQPSGLTMGSITLTNLPTGASSSINGSSFVVDKKVYTGLLAGVYNIKVRLNTCESINQATLTNSSLRTFDPASCYYIISKTSNKVLEVKDASQTDGAQIYQFTASTTKKNQFWQIVKTSDGSFNIISKNGNKLIDAPDCTEGAIIQQYAADGTSSQKWQIVPQSDGSVKLLNVSCNKYLRVESASTADRASVGIKNDFGAESFKWYIAVAPCVPDNCPPTPILSYVLPTFGSFGSITVTNLPPNVSTSLEGPLIDNPVFTLNKAVYQVAAEGTYKIKLRINGCTTEATANLTRTRTPVTYAAGCFRIINKATGKALTVKNAALTDGAAIVQAAYTGSANQLWTQSVTSNFASAAGTGYISKNSKAWLNANAPDSFCLTGTTPAYQSQFMFQWFPQIQADGSFKLFKYPQAICNKLVLRVANNTSEIVSSATDTNDDFSKWLIDSVSCTTPAVASATAETFGFEARASEGRTKLQWITNTGYKNDYFEVERLNANGSFDILGRQNTYAGDDMKSYTFTDNNPLDGDNFYRINSISQNGTPQYSEVKKVIFSKNDGISIFPNPADEFINVDLRKYEGKTVALSVYNSVGLLVKKQTIEKVSAALQQIDIQGFGVGSYLLRVQSEGKREVTRLFYIVK